MSDKECFDFLKNINYDKQYFLDKGWTKKYYHFVRNYKWWPEAYKDEPGSDETDYVWFPPGFKLSEEEFDYDKGIFPKKCCINCINSKGKYYKEYHYGCKLPEIRAAHDSTILKEKDYISAGHSNPCFVSKVEFAPHAICDYFYPTGLNYQI